jgi:hypothetical protein
MLFLTEQMLILRLLLNVQALNVMQCLDLNEAQCWSIISATGKSSKITVYNLIKTMIIDNSWYITKYITVNWINHLIKILLKWKLVGPLSL